MFRTKDGGKTWDRVLFRDEKTGAVDLVMDPKNPDVLYATLWEVFRTPYSLSSGGPGSGLFKTTDGGNTWTELTKNAGPAGADLGQGRHRGLGRRQQSPVRDHRGEGRRHLHVGRCGRDVETGERGPAHPSARVLLHAHLRRSRRRRTRSTSSTPASTARPTPARRSAAIPVPHGDNHDLWIAPNDPKRMINTNDGGANVSVNGGESWTGQRTRRRSSTTSSRPTTCRITSAARSRTTRPPACRATAPATTSTTSAAARAATSRRIRATPTCSTPAATAAC